MRIIFLYTVDDQDSTEMYKKLIKYGLRGRITLIEINDASTLQWLSNNSKNVNIYELPCFLIQKKTDLGKLETEVISYKEIDYVLNMLNINDFF